MSTGIKTTSGIYLLKVCDKNTKTKVNNRDTRTLDLVFLSQLASVFLLLILNRLMSTWVISA